ncbi:chromosome partitioning protein, ParA [Mycobacteroides abscessus subsp. abscessus]|nr:chromosome partitioning protein, ParA [Mycobacteroides abscessus subsp. abscessus]
MLSVMTVSADKQCEILAIALQKGGVGKTTTTINLGANLATMGHRVLVIDMDQQAHSTKGLGIQLDADDASMYEVLHPDRTMRVPLAKVIVSSQFGIDVAPGHLALKELERTGLGSGGQLRLARQLDDIEGYDYVLLDCPPALGELTTAALAAADYVLAVLKAGPDEVDGLVELGNSILDVQETLNPDVEIRYVLLADFDGNPKASKDVRRQLRADWGEWADGGAYLGEIPHTVRVVEAKGKRVPVNVHAPTSTAAVAYREVAERIAARRSAA